MYISENQNYKYHKYNDLNFIHSAFETTLQAIFITKSLILIKKINQKQGLLP